MLLHLWNNSVGVHVLSCTVLVHGCSIDCVQSSTFKSYHARVYSVRHSYCFQYYTLLGLAFKDFRRSYSRSTFCFCFVLLYVSAVMHPRQVLNILRPKMLAFLWAMGFITHLSWSRLIHLFGITPSDWRQFLHSAFWYCRPRPGFQRRSFEESGDGRGRAFGSAAVG